MQTFRYFFFRVAVLIFLAGGGIAFGWYGVTAAQDNPRAHVGFWISNYPLADPEQEPLTAKAYQVFEKVRAVADKRNFLLPKLTVIDTAGDPWAIALPDGHIVFTQKAVEICFQGCDVPEGEARLAFILGHELGHMAEDDYWHLQTYRALSNHPEYQDQAALLTDTTERSEQEREQYARAVKGLIGIITKGGDVDRQKQAQVVQAKEMRADDRGFMYAAMAGYRVDLLLGDQPAVGRDFFTYWVSQIPHAASDPFHPSATQRAAFLKNRLQTLSTKLPFFHFGVRLAHFSRFEDALYFFTEFQHVFPSREVLSNMGYCHLMLALRELPDALAHRFWLPLALDLQSQAENLVLKGCTEGSSMSTQARQSLRDAAECLEKACEMDPGYLPARLNLAYTRLLQGEQGIYQARAVIEQAMRVAPRDSRVLALRALIIAEQGQSAETWPQAVTLLEDLAREESPPAWIHYNLAVLLEERGRSGKAESLWKLLAEQGGAFVEPYLSRIAQENPSKAVSGFAFEDAPKVPWLLPVKTGTDLYKDSKSRALLETWGQTPFDWFSGHLSGTIYHDPDTAEVLAFEGFVEMIVLKGQQLGTLDALKARAGEPLARSQLSGGEIWTYAPNWAVLIQEQQLQAAWIVHQ